MAFLTNLFTFLPAFAALVILAKSLALVLLTWPLSTMASQCTRNSSGMSVYSILSAFLGRNLIHASSASDLVSSDDSTGLAVSSDDSTGLAVSSPPNSLLASCCERSSLSFLALASAFNLSAFGIAARLASRLACSTSCAAIFSASARWVSARRCIILSIRLEFSRRISSSAACLASSSRRCNSRFCAIIRWRCNSFSSSFFAIAARFCAAISSICSGVY